MTDMKDLAKEALELFEEKKVKKAQAVFSNTQQKEFNLVNNEFTLFRTVFNQDINVVTYKDQKKGSYFINKVSKEDLKIAIDMAILSAESSEADKAYDISESQGELEVKKGIIEPDINELFLKTEELFEDIKQRYSMIIVQELIVSHIKSHKVFVNTNHTLCDEKSGYYLIQITFAGHKEDKTTSLFGTEFITVDLKKKFIDQGDLILQLEAAKDQLNASPLEEKFNGTVIFTPSCLNMFLNYIYNLTGDKNILDKSCIWIDRLEEKVADQRLSIRIDPMDERIVCGETLTSEGYKSEKFDFILRGILKNFAIHAYVSKKTGYKKASCDAFHVIIEPGDTKYEEMIKHVEHGIVIGGFSGGNPSSNGDFSGVAKNSLLIENGKIVRPITETMINGNLANMLYKIRDISVETIEDGTSVLPYMSFDEILISGK